MQTKHTPGPWLTATTNWQDLETIEIYAEGKDAWIAQVLHDRTVYSGVPVSKEEGEANAKLMAAAPDLLHELRTLIDICLTYGYYKGIEAELNSAEQAIKKATT
jgi:hypothetical protein